MRGCYDTQMANLEAEVANKQALAESLVRERNSLLVRRRGRAGRRESERHRGRHAAAQGQCSCVNACTCHVYFKTLL